MDRHRGRPGMWGGAGRAAGGVVVPGPPARPSGRTGSRYRSTVAPGGAELRYERARQAAALLARPPGDAVLPAGRVRARTGHPVSVQILRADQQWAIHVAHQAGLGLKPTGPLCRQGNIGPLTPYLPHTGVL